MSNYKYVSPSINYQEDLEEAIYQYNEDISLANDSEKRLTAIIDFIYNVEHIHPFYDGNLRTLVIALLTRLLVQNGFPPATWYDPEIFEFFSKKEIKQNLLEAMDNSKAIHQSLFNFDSKLIPDEKQQQYNEWIKPLRNVIQQEMDKIAKLRPVI